MKTTIILALLVAAVVSQPVAKEEVTASKRATVLAEVQIPDSEPEASENKEKRGAARLTPVSSNSLNNERPSINPNQHQNQLSEIAQLTQLAPQASQQLFAPHPYSFVFPYHQPKLTYSAKSPYLIPQQQQQLLQLPSFGPQHQQYMLIIPPQHSAAQHQLLMLIAPPSATGFHYIAQPPAPHTGIPPQHLINFYAGQPQHQPQQPLIHQREQALLQPIPQQTQQQIHIPNNQQIQQQNTRVVYTQEQPSHLSYQTIIPQEQQQPIISSQQFVQKTQPQQHQQIHQQNQQQQQQYFIEDSAPTPATLVNTYGSRLHSQPSHHQQQQQQNQQQQYKTIIKV